MKQLNNDIKKAWSLYIPISDDPFYLILQALLQIHRDTNWHNILFFQNKGKSPPGCSISPRAEGNRSGTTSTPAFPPLGKKTNYNFNILNFNYL
jgi:hypothetical protein